MTLKHHNKQMNEIVSIRITMTHERSICASIKPTLVFPQIVCYDTSPLNGES